MNTINFGMGGREIFSWSYRINEIPEIYFIWKFFQLSSYSSFVDDLQRDSDEEVDSGKTSAVELPFQENSHFKKFLPVLKKMLYC